jgi:hypothetical protein
MNALVVYESMVAITRKIAAPIRQSLGECADVRTVYVAAKPAQITSGAHTLTQAGS